MWPFLLAGIITLCSGYPAAVPEIRWLEPDKLGHFVAYGTLATAILRHPRFLRRPALGALGAFLLASGYGLGDEFRQTLNAYRSYDLADWAADSLGALVAVASYVYWPRYRRLLETPVWPRRAKPKPVPGPEADWPQKTQEAQK